MRQRFRRKRKTRRRDSRRVGWGTSTTALHIRMYPHYPRGRDAALDAGEAVDVDSGLEALPADCVVCVTPVAHLLRV